MKSKMITKQTFFYRLIRFMQWMIVLIGLVIAARGATFALQPPEQDPETFSYRIHEFHPRLGTFYYVIHWADSKVADATITIERDGEYYRMTADEEITKFLDRTYRIKYRGETTIRAEDLAPVETVINQELGRKQTTEQIRYDAEGKAEVVVTKKEPDAPFQQEAYHINEETFAIDMFSAIFLTRSFDWQENESQQFDVVTLSQVIEHIHDPIVALREVHRILKPGGKIWIATPNLDGAGNRLFKCHWRGLEPPRHLMIFNGSSLKLACERAGFIEPVLRRSTPTASWYFMASLRILHNLDPTQLEGETLPMRLKWHARWVNLKAIAMPEQGEELTVIATKP